MIRTERKQLRGGAETPTELAPWDLGGFPRSKLRGRSCVVTFFIVLLVSGASALAQTAPSDRFLLGADVSALASIEQRGGIFKDREGNPGDALTIFSRAAWKCFRLRIFVKPNGRGGTVNTFDYTRALAKRIKATGATLLLDFQYSDTWADPQHQVKPAAWKDLSFDDLEKQVERYTAEVMRDLKNSGATPDIVQVGNEITGGTLWPDAQVKVPPSDVKVFEGDVRVIAPPEPYDDAKQWEHLARVFKAGVRGVRSATDESDHVRIMLHIDCGGDWPVTKWFFDHVVEHNVPFDLIGQSYYPRWHGTLQNVRDNLRGTARRYRKPIVIVETAYPWKNADEWSKRKNMAWPITREGQAQFLGELIEAVKQTADGLGAGVVWWFPESIVIRSGGATRPSWGGGAMALFDDDGVALPAMDVLNVHANGRR